MKIYKPPKQQYKDWLIRNRTRTFNQKEKDEMDIVMRNRLLRELDWLQTLDIKEYMLVHKFDEMNQLFQTKEKVEIDRVKSLIWKPKGRSDFRRIEPELILCSDQYKIKQIDFFGHVNFTDYENEEQYTRHWNIMRSCVSSHTNDGQIGRQLRYIVRDKITRTYLGIIMIASCLMNLSERNKHFFGEGEEGNKLRKNCFRPGKSTSLSMATAQTIVATQPFGMMFNGGKLLALLCTSNKVQNDWKRIHGDVLVSVDTTSLYGKKPLTQYDGLRPYWRNLGKTSGNTVMKPRDETYQRLRRWCRKRHSEKYFKTIEQINTKGQPAVREKKNKMIKDCYRFLGVDKSHSSITGHKRGIYLAKLYENADLFLQEKISEKDLIPSFDNSVETLTEFWRFGYEQDTLKDEVNPEIAKHYKKKYRTEKKLSAKYRIQELQQRGYHYIQDIHDWYGDMHKMKWKDVKEKFLHKVGA